TSYLVIQDNKAFPKRDTGKPLRGRVRRYLRVDLATEQIAPAHEPVEEQQAIEVIHFVLHGTGLVTFAIELVRRTIAVLVTQADVLRARNVARVVRHRQTTFAPERLAFA